MTDEERKAIERFKNFIYTYQDIIEDEYSDYEEKESAKEYQEVSEKILNLIEKQSKEIEELKREKEINQQMIHLAETQILGYEQGYKDGLNKETTATQIVARERENQIIYEGIKHKINMEWVLKIKAKIEELDKEIKVKREIAKNPMDRVSGRLLTDSIIELEKTKKVLQSLLEKE